MFNNQVVGLFGTNFDIGAVGVTAKYQNGDLEIGASAGLGVTISINIFELYEWIEDREDVYYAYVN